MLARSPIKRKSKAKPAIYKRYHGWVAQFSCVGCGASPVHVHHIRSDGLKSISKNDEIVAPICPDCHQNAPYAIHKTSHAAYNKMFGIDLYQYALALWDKFNG